MKRVNNLVRTVMSAEVHTVGSTRRQIWDWKQTNPNQSAILSNIFIICLSPFAALLDQIDSHYQSPYNKQCVENCIMLGPALTIADHCTPLSNALSIRKASRSPESILNGCIYHPKHRLEQSDLCIPLSHKPMTER